MAAVVPIAMAPQKVTLNIGLRMPAPPACAPTAPNTASATREPAETTHGIRGRGEAMAIITGMAAPTDDVIRNSLAVFLHERHPRTQHPRKPTMLT